ncbi:toll/interleukin-1 receptor domain-containing protein [Lentzea sp. BCCO 10_0856]|uniref:Toll/interleukin-1 receptor domain-containing protein n=1 Tax=Lentzea miocenica TaxID=3095431 RepID=A0ABU4T649_9PSEU|nr:toll/interleukin-1 receptor domain-containing protein [Lentzea sp. BCCO 10_0856]MDX8033413.1 toll/interleukin-1 receptor domain-containing protein [Lentzea sp. BCCO 10_0856]
MRFWAFLSYSWSDRSRAVSLHRKLERFVVPRHARRMADPQGPPGRRLRPVFRDDDEMAASGPLGERLRTAIDEAPAMVLLASPASARSHYVNLEVEHFLTNHDPKRLVIVAVGDSTRDPELPAALDHVDEPLWVDVRGGRRLTRRDLVRVAAIVLDVGFEALWRRHVRYLRQLAALWCALVLVVGGVVGWALVRQQEAEKRSPEQQRAQFVEWMTGEVTKTDLPGIQVKLNITRVDDFDNDGLMEFFVRNETMQFCGSGGCAFEVYRTTSPGAYVRVLELLGTSTPRVRAAADGTKEIIVSELAVSREPLYTVYTLRDSKFRLKHYEFCDGLVFEVCDKPTVITPIPYENAPPVQQDVIARERPVADAREVRVGATDTKENGGFTLEVRGQVAGGEWYLVSVWKQSCGFVPASAVGSR